MMNMVNKETAIKDYLAMIKQSWTWSKLTEEEKECFETFLASHPMVEHGVRGNYSQRWIILEAIYLAFLTGCGYRNRADWRD